MAGQLREFLKREELWHEEHKDGFLICVDDPCSEPETRDLSDGHAGYLRQLDDGTVILDMEDFRGYGGTHHLESVDEFDRFWMDAMSDGFCEISWSSYNFAS